MADAVGASVEDWDAEDCLFQYDSNGNVTSITEANDGAQVRVITVEYDHRNLPIYLHITDYTLDQEVFYRYNADGQRIFKKVGSMEAEHYIMDGDQNLAVFDESGSLKYWNVFANGLAGRVKATGEKLYYLKDHLGSTRAVIKDDGTVVEAHDYYPFGLLMPGRDTQTGGRTKELFTGKERDVETGLDYFGARYYWPAGGRWWSVDPLAEKYPTLSPYSFTANNPVNYIERDGRFFDILADVAFIAYDVYDIASTALSGGEVSGTQWAALGADVAGALIPGATGGGVIVRGNTKAAKTLQKNKIVGKQGEKIVTEVLEKEAGSGKDILTNVTGKFDDGTTTKFDNVVVDQKTSKVDLVNETKTGNATHSKQ